MRTPPLDYLPQHRVLPRQTEVITLMGACIPIPLFPVPLPSSTLLLNVFECFLRFTLALCSPAFPFLPPSSLSDPSSSLWWPSLSGPVATSLVFLRLHSQMDSPFFRPTLTSLVLNERPRSRLCFPCLLYCYRNYQLNLFPSFCATGSGSRGAIPLMLIRTCALLFQIYFSACASARDSVVYSVRAYVGRLPFLLFSSSFRCL